MDDDIQEAMLCTNKVSKLADDYVVSLDLPTCLPEEDQVKMFSISFCLEPGSDIEPLFKKLKINALIDPMAKFMHSLTSRLSFGKYLLEHFNRDYAKMMIVLEGDKVNNYREYWNLKVMSMDQEGGRITLHVAYEHYNDMIINKDADITTVGITEVMDGATHLHEFRPWA